MSDIGNSGLTLDGPLPVSHEGQHPYNSTSLYAAKTRVHTTTRMTSSIEVSPSSTFSKPSSLSVFIPSATA